MKAFRLGTQLCYSPQDWRTDRQPGWRQTGVIVSLTLIAMGLINALLP